MVETDIKLTVGDLYDYNLRHSYTQIPTLLATIAGIAGIAVGIYWRQQYWLMMVIIGALLVFYMPITLLVKTSQTMALSPAMKNPVHYLLNEDGITVSQGEQSQTLPWSGVHKAVSTGRSIILYTSKNSASVFPRKQVGESLPLLIQTISANLDPKRNKIKQ
ncbi:MAG: YcxB family protein [Lachnospiraceae bacterium]|nr:YcxB family protein [Lachnospiraceae bacterium]